MGTVMSQRRSLTFIVLTIAVLANVAPSLGAKKKHDDPGSSGELSHAQKRIQREVEAMNKEGLPQVVASLGKISGYMSPMADSNELATVRLPLAPKYGTVDFDRILSNRRFLRAFELLKRMNRAEAEKVVNQAIRTALDEYSKEFDASLAKSMDHFHKSKAPVGVMSFQISDNPDGRPTLAGSRYRVLSLVVLAGALELKGSAGDVQKVVDLACKQHATLTSMQEDYRLEYVIAMLGQGSLWSREVLLTGMLGTASKEMRATPLLQTYVGQVKTIAMPRYNAPTTPYDQAAFFPGAKKSARVNLELEISRASSVPDEVLLSLVKTLAKQ
jgi:hypothetical protein